MSENMIPIGAIVPWIPVVTALFHRGREVLMTRRPPTARMFADHWEIGCGGKIEPGEFITQALLREIEEELGLQNVPIKDFLGQALIEEYGYVIYLYRCEIPAGAEPEPRQVAEIRWVDVDEIPGFLMVPSGERFYPVVRRAVVR